MCGIVGYVGDRKASSILLEGLRRLEYRGYDSAGIAVGHTPIGVHRAVGRVADLGAVVPDGLDATTGIAHTRWATHGGVTVENAHPHVDGSGKIAGPQRHHRECPGCSGAPRVRGRRLQLRDRYRSPRSPDSAKCLEEEGDPLSAVTTALQLVRGTWGVAVLFSTLPDTIIAARNGSPPWLASATARPSSRVTHALVPHAARDLPGRR